MDKTIISAQELLEDSFRLGVKVLESGFEPTMIIAIWRGGTPVGMALQEILAYCGIEADHIAIRTSSYSGVDQRGAVAVHGLNYMVKKVSCDDRVLIVDDVFDTGNTIKAVIDEITMRARGNTPGDMRVAVPWYKPTSWMHSHRKRCARSGQNYTQLFTDPGLLSLSAQRILTSADASRCRLRHCGGACACGRAAPRVCRPAILRARRAGPGLSPCVALPLPRGRCRILRKTRSRH